jgi:hypothetical protein
MSIDIKDVFELLSSNSDFVKKIEVAVHEITKDGKIDSSDIPEFIFIITESYNTYTTIKITQNDLPIFIKMVVNEIIKRKNLISLDKKQEFDKLVDSALKLVMMQPRVQETIESCFKCLPCCFTHEKGVAKYEDGKK